MHLTPL